MVFGRVLGEEEQIKGQLSPNLTPWLRTWIVHQHLGAEPLTLFYTPIRIRICAVIFGHSKMIMPNIFADFIHRATARENITDSVIWPVRDCQTGKLNSNYYNADTQTEALFGRKRIWIKRLLHCAAASSLLLRIFNQSINQSINKSKHWWVTVTEVSRSWTTALEHSSSRTSSTRHKL